MQGLTKRQSEILSYIQNFIQTNNFSPSYREIRDYFDFNSLGSVYKHINVLKRKGILAGEKNTSRSLTLANKLAQNTHSGIDIPYIGSLVAGHPIETFAHFQSLSVPESMIHNPKNTYALKVKGESLNEELISDGDILLVEARSEANEGETIIALINQHETVVKKYYPDGIYIRLLGVNPNHQAIMLREQDLLIQGIIVGLIRTY